MAFEMTKYERSGQHAKPGTKHRDAWARAVARENGKVWRRVDERERERAAQHKAAKR